MLFETAGPNSYTKNIGNFWVFEGLGTYFETVTPQPDGSLEVGGLVGPRIAEAYQSWWFGDVRYRWRNSWRSTKRQFRDKVQIYHNYQQAMALTVFLMQWNHGAYRDDVSRLRSRRLSRADQAWHRPVHFEIGCISRTRSLDKQFLTFLKDGKAAQQGPEPSRGRSRPRRAIRTVPGR